MSWDKWIPAKFQVKSEVCAIEAVFAENGVSFIYTILKKDNKALKIAGSAEITSLKEIPAKCIKSKIPVVLIVNGRGVIVKEVNSEQISPSLEFILGQLPAINKDEFYVQFYPQHNQKGFITICRREQVDALVEEIQKLKIPLANVYLGSPSVLGMKPFFSQFNSIPTTLTNIEITNEHIERFTQGNDESASINIEDLNISKRHVLGMAGGLAYLTQNPINVTYDESISGLYKAHTENNKLRVLTALGVTLMFIIAVTNMLVYSSRFDRNNKLETELAVYQGKYDQINQLLNEYQKKKGLIEDAGLLTRNRLSEFADKIAATIPREVVLTNLYFNPKTETDTYEDSLTRFNSKQVIVQGNCGKSLVVNEWLNVLKMQEFIAQVNLEKFSYNKSDLMPNFEIRIMTK